MHCDEPAITADEAHDPTSEESLILVRRENLSVNSFVILQQGSEKDMYVPFLPTLTSA